jgi:hypothetical protein
VGTGDFTVEWFQFMTGQTANNVVFQLGVFGSSGNPFPGGISFNFDQAGVLTPQLYISGSRYTWTPVAGILNTWRHIAITRAGTLIRLYINGVLIDSAPKTQTGTGDVNDATNEFTIGNNSGTTAGQRVADSAFIGSITSFNFIKGQAIYQGGSLNVPTSPINGGANSKLLLLVNSAAAVVTDSSPAGKTVTSVGTSFVGISPFTSYSVIGGSFAFAGTSNSYVRLAAGDSDFQPGTGDFTVEWFQFTGQPSTISSNGYYPVTFALGVYPTAALSFSLDTRNAPGFATTDNGLFWTNYTGYFADNPNWFLTATAFGTGTTTAITSPTFGSASNISTEYVGYFKPNTTGFWSFRTNSDDASYIWLGQYAVSGYSAANSDPKYPGLHSMGGFMTGAAVRLVADVFYPIRIQYGNATGSLGVVIEFSGPGVSWTSNGTGYFFNTGNVVSAGGADAFINRPSLYIQGIKYTWNPLGSGIYNSWRHFAISRSGTTVRLYMNGALVDNSTRTSSGSITDSASEFTIGNDFKR